MRKVTLKKLSLENYKGRTMSFDFSDGRTIIRGTNEAGKSTLANAFFWLLMGVDAQDRTNYELYDSTLEFTPKNAVPAVVEGAFDIDGSGYVFKRIAKQKWVRKRGRAEYEKAPSDDYTFYVDGLAVSANVYKERIEALFAPIDKLKLMLNVRYYQTLDWKKLRKHFADMVGIINESELQGDYSAIDELLEKYGSVDFAKEKLRQDINPKKRALENVEAEIKGMKVMLPSLEGIEESTKKRAEIVMRIAEIDEEIMGLGEANKPYVEKRRKEEDAIRNRKIALDGERIVWYEEQNEPIHKIIQQIQDVNGKNAEIRELNERIVQQRISINIDIERDEQHLVFLKEELERLRNENKAIKDRAFDENQVCPNCGQPLPYDKVSEIRERFFNQRLADKKKCVERGLKTKAQIESLEKAIAEKKEQIATLPELQKVLSVDELEIKLEEAKTRILPFEQSEIYAKLTKEIVDMETNLTVVPKLDSAELVAEKQRLNNAITELNGIVGRKAERERGEARIKDKEKEQSEVGVELARLEGLFNKCVEREREWASIVRDKANGHLHYSHVEMTEMTKAGEIVDVCTLTARNVPAGSQNNATQILIGVDVARAFQINAGVNLPIFIDNAEGIVSNNLPECDNQIILLYVDENYKELTAVK